MSDQLEFIRPAAGSNRGYVAYGRSISQYRVASGTMARAILPVYFPETPIVMNGMVANAAVDRASAYVSPLESIFMECNKEIKKLNLCQKILNFLIH